MRSIAAVGFLFVALFAATGFAAVGGDVAEYYSSAAWSCAVQNGWDFVVVRSYCSYGAVDPNVVNTLAAAAAGGISYRDIYHFPCVGQDASTQIQADVNNVGLGNFGTLWLDIESNPSPGCGWSSDQTQNCQFLSSLISAAQSAGATVGVYSSVYEWGLTVGAGCTAGADAGVPLWYANWDNAQSFGDFQSFGGWTSPSMKQDADSVGGICGLNADADWY